ncbi:hemolysin [Pseudoalteromonas sp. S201]|uniref:choice-of-anchor A family protein n=1 Tax=unclassified Pseudoalteromonas TaxID=194690 RepID=UPI00110B6A10|nr:MULTISPECIES: choice-of-anchor A family protein [unclassified Pseudoalteromonas]TMP45488.1 hemolysin [Pseudoalteromonas sp. S1688]TMS92386.1 hemolysin [Pseudoalteromonas sp. S201]
MTNSLLKFKKLSAVIALTLASSSTLAADLGVANDFSAFVFNDFKSNFGRADGAIAAGEIDLKGYSVGYRRPSNPSEYYLISDSSIDFKYGRQYVGSIIATGGTDVNWAVRWGMERGSEILSNQEQSALPFNFDEQEQYYKDLSAELGKLDATGTVQSKWGGLYLQGDGSSNTQVFNLDARQFAKAHTFKVWGIPSDATVIFNITGDDNVVVKGKSFAWLRAHATKTVFNFTNAQKLDIKGNRWEGVVLAPYADIRGVYGTAKMPIIGQSFYGSMALLGGEFNGELPSKAQPIAPFEMTQKWHWNSSNFMPEYNQVMATPVVVQLNDDNGDSVIDNNDIADVVVVSFRKGSFNNGVVRALSGIDGSELWDYSQGAIMADASYSVAAADLNNDGIVEIVASSRFEDFVSVIDNNGVTIKQIAKVNSGWKTASNIAIADINNDGSLEFTLGDAVYNYETGSLFNVNWSPTYTIFDSNNDDVQEILSRGQLLDSNGANLWSYTGESDVWFSSIADIDNDQKPEIILSMPSGPTSTTSRIVALEDDGNVKWEVDTASSPGGGAQAISNFLGANSIGIVHAGYTSVTMYDEYGQLVWSVPNSDEWSGKLGISAYDFNGDGIDEVIVQDNLTVRVLNGVNGEVLSLVNNSTGSLWEYPIVVDLAGDNNAELITVSNNYDSRYSINNGVTVYGAADNSKPWKNATRIWNQHSYHQTNINQNGTVPTVELPSWLNNNTYRSSTLK